MAQKIDPYFPIMFTGPKELGRWIKKLRKYRGMTQYDVSQYTNLSVKFISNVENGKENTHLEKVLFILRVLDIGVQLTDLRRRGSGA